MTANELEYGVPFILNQMIETLRHAQASPSPREDSIVGDSPETPGSVESGQTAALDGTELFRMGYTVDQVVHDYGDICQVIAELAQEINAPITVDEFHTFDRFLDNSIANAVSTYERQQHSGDFDEGVQARAHEQRMLLDKALRALHALKVGNIGLMGATGAVLEDSLLKLRDLNDR